MSILSKMSVDPSRQSVSTQQMFVNAVQCPKRRDQGVQQGGTREEMNNGNVSADICTPGHIRMFCLTNTYNGRNRGRGHSQVHRSSQCQPAGPAQRLRELVQQVQQVLQDWISVYMYIILISGIRRFVNILERVGYKFSKSLKGLTSSFPTVC